VGERDFIYVVWRLVRSGFTTEIKRYTDMTPPLYLLGWKRREKRMEQSEGREGNLNKMMRRVPQSHSSSHNMAKWPLTIYAARVIKKKKERDHKKDMEE